MDTDQHYDNIILIYKYRLDRLLLAVSLTLYMVISWEPTLDDKRYHQQQLAQKKQQMEYTTRRKQQATHQKDLRNYRG